MIWKEPGWSPHFDLKGSPGEAGERRQLGPLSTCLKDIDAGWKKPCGELALMQGHRCWQAPFWSRPSSVLALRAYLFTGRLTLAGGPLGRAARRCFTFKVLPSLVVPRLISCREGIHTQVQLQLSNAQILTLRDTLHGDKGDCYPSRFSAKYFSPFPY